VENLGELVFVAELLDTSGSVDNLLRTGEEGVTLVADIDREFRLVGADGEFVSAGTFDVAVHIFGMNTFFHQKNLL
jgi:predicted amidohydrolase